MGYLAIILALLLALEIFVESIGLLGEKYKPLMHLIQKIINKKSKVDPTVEVWHLGQEKPDQLKSKKDNK